MPERHGTLHGKVAIVTGGSMGLGEGTVFDINKDLGQKLVQTLLEKSVSFFKGDVTNENPWTAALKHVLDTFDQLDIVVNNAGVVHRSAVSVTLPPIQTCSSYKRA